MKLIHEWKPITSNYWRADKRKRKKKFRYNYYFLSYCQHIKIHKIEVIFHIFSLIYFQKNLILHYLKITMSLHLRFCKFKITLHTLQWFPNLPFKIMQKCGSRINSEPFCEELYVNYLNQFSIYSKYVYILELNGYLINI